MSDFNGKHPDGTPVEYHFVNWITALEENLPRNATPDVVANMVATEATIVFAPIDEEIRSGRMKQGNLQEKFKVLAEYVVFGYVSGEPRICVVEFYIDWDGKKVLEPKTFVLHPGPGAEGRGYTFYSFGITQALDDISNTSSYAYQSVIKECPTLALLMTGHDIGLDTATGIARAEIHVQEKVNPSRVFGDIATVRILPDGRLGTVKIVSPKDHILCTPVHAKPKKKPETKPQPH